MMVREKQALQKRRKSTTKGDTAESNERSMSGSRVEWEKKWQRQQEREEEAMPAKQKRLSGKERSHRSVETRTGLRDGTHVEQKQYFMFVHRRTAAHVSDALQVPEQPYTGKGSVQLCSTCHSGAGAYLRKVVVHVTHMALPEGMPNSEAPALPAR